MIPVLVYAIRFIEGGIYVGLTKDLTRRMEEHRRKQSPSLKRFSGEFSIIYQREFETYAQARTHEKYLKSGAGRALLESIRT